MRLLPIALLALLASGCATRGGVQVSPEGTAALRANQVVQALRQVVTPVGSSPLEQLVIAKAITREDGEKVAKALAQAFTYAGDLAAVLKIADDAQNDADRHAGLIKAAVLVNSIANGLDEAVLSVGAEDGRRKVAELLRLASSVLLTVGSLFPVPAGAQ